MFRTKLHGVAVKIETTAGTWSAPDGTNALRTIGMPSLSIDYLDNGDRSDEEHNGMGTVGHAESTGRWAKVDFQLPMRGAGADYFTITNRPEVDPILRACGLSVTASGGSGSGKLVYTTLDGGTFETVSVACWQGNKVFQIQYGVATIKWSIEAAQRGVWDVSITGVLTSDPSELAVPSLTQTSVVPPKFHTNAVVLTGISTATAGVRVRRVAGDLGNTIQPLPSAGASDGIVGFVITNRMVTHSGTIDVLPRATHDPFAVGKGDSTNIAATTYQVGSTSFNRVKFNIGRWAYRTPKFNDENGIFAYPLEGPVAARSLISGDGVGRELAITFD